MQLVLGVLSTQAGQVGLVAMQAPGVKAAALCLGLVLLSIFHQRQDLAAEAELRPQERLGRAVGEGSRTVRTAVINDGGEVLVPVIEWALLGWTLRLLGMLTEHPFGSA